jgi:AbrB family looped-hinge helix DNA binding protein
MTVRLSTKGQLIIPQPIRKMLGLKPGMEFDVRVKGNEITLIPLAHTSPIDALFGKYIQTNLLAELEAEHQQEIQSEKRA